MNYTLHLADRIRRGDAIPMPLAAVLQACTPATRIGMWWRLKQPVEHVEAHVVSFGNITAGGTGKTPAVIERAQQELAAGKRVAVLTRGYGAPSGNTPLDSSELADPSRHLQLGDEAVLILKKAPGVIVLKNADRVASARLAVERHRCDTLILDDGYQFTRLARDENVLLIDATNPFGSGALIPRGILREPLTAIARATEIVLTRCDQAGDTRELAETIRKYALDATIRQTCHAPSLLWNVANGSKLPLSELKGKEIVAACAIGHPESFFETLESLGATISDRIMCRDHQPIPESQLPTDRMVVLTEKDAVRMDYARENIYALGITLQDITP